MGCKAGNILETCLFATVGAGMLALVSACQVAAMGMDPLPVHGYLLPVLFGAAGGVAVGAYVCGLRMRLEALGDRSPGPVAAAARPSRRIRVIAEPGYDTATQRIPVHAGPRSPAGSPRVDIESKQRRFRRVPVQRTA